MVPGTQATIYRPSRKYRGAGVFNAVYTAAFPGAAVYSGISPERRPTEIW